MFIDLLLSVTLFAHECPKEAKANPPIYISFLWHMHQPIYWSYESIVQTQDNHRSSYLMLDD